MIKTCSCNCTAWTIEAFSNDVRSFNEQSSFISISSHSVIHTNKQERSKSCYAIAHVHYKQTLKPVHTVKKSVKVSPGGSSRGRRMQRGEGGKGCKGGKGGGEGCKGGANGAKRGKGG